MEPLSLNAEVAKKYECLYPLNGQKCLFPHSSKHGVGNKALHTLTVTEVDALMEAKAVEGVFRLKGPGAPAAKPVKETAPVVKPKSKARSRARN